NCQSFDGTWKISSREHSNASSYQTPTTYFVAPGVLKMRNRPRKQVIRRCRAVELGGMAIRDRRS
ncbi:MAG: hypothetical protein J2P37_34100, partial [Ktedonobacteraceae bacterium]|nr:hypothetical protein [Ktedonobacteraceae bacterium]